MVKKEFVSVNWQSVFMLIPFVDLWAAYRIEKLRLFLLYLVVVGLIIFFVLGFALFQERLFEDESENLDVKYFGIGFDVAWIGASIVVIRKWSREWNEKINSTKMPP
ncbi:hypothetical protein [Nitrosopumilus sp.]|uniref:hypothetical protein n=1 Tax=Nitrosopumilus sp. TaxID=2024843 RepID=UPI00293079E2|nr:hypothetical protein [Nitrosopumilus sp.]